MWWLMLLWLQNNANANTKKTIRKALSVILALFCKFFKKTLRTLAMSQVQVCNLNLQVHKNAKLTDNPFSHGLCWCRRWGDLDSL